MQEEEDIQVIVMAVVICSFLVGHRTIPGIETGLEIAGEILEGIVGTETEIGIESGVVVPKELEQGTVVDGGDSSAEVCVCCIVLRWPTFVYFDSVTVVSSYILICFLMFFFPDFSVLLSLVRSCLSLVSCGSIGCLNLFSCHITYP